MNQQVLRKSLEKVSPQTRTVLAREAEQRGVSIEQVFLDEMLEIAGPLKGQLYSLRRQSQLRVVK